MAQKAKHTGLVGRAMLMATVAATIVLSVAEPVAAQRLGADGRVTAFVDCNVDTHVATITVRGTTPSSYKTTGFYFKTQVYAKTRAQTTWTYLNQRTALVKTWTKANSYTWVETPKTLVGASFQGLDYGYYDVLVKYWFRSPSQSTWQGPRMFQVPGDSQSTIQTTYWDGLTNQSFYSSECYLWW